MLADSCLEAAEEIAIHASKCLKGTVEGFRSVIAPTTACASIEASVAAGRQRFLPEKFGECVRAIRERECEDVDPEHLEPGRLFEGCPAFTAQAELNSACASNADCTNGWCDLASGCLGLCRAYASTGGACTTLDECAPGSYCSNGLCIAAAKEGERCNETLKCTSGSKLGCAGSEVCVKRKDSGSCKEDWECLAGYQCVSLLTSGNKECRPTKAHEESCVVGTGECGVISFCDKDTNTCQRYPGPGQPCGYLTDRTGELVRCLDSRCDVHLPEVREGRCKLPFFALGDRCDTNVECGPENACRNKVCVRQWCISG
ncbi:Dickkopf N-terminal cysteine-rich domain-containing protein [Myxococcus fulvus]|nr:Dickkopf N-terminal cysteine-rich domain-containing protein [Myxococcus fulvus]